MAKKKKIKGKRLNGVNRLNKNQYIYNTTTSLERLIKKYGDDILNMPPDKLIKLSQRKVQTNPRKGETSVRTFRG